MNRKYVVYFEKGRKSAPKYGQVLNLPVLRVEWHFTTADAHTKLKRLYPRIHD